MIKKRKVFKKQNNFFSVMCIIFALIFTLGLLAVISPTKKSSGGTSKNTSSTEYLEPNYLLGNYFRHNLSVTLDDTSVLTFSVYSEDFGSSITLNNFLGLLEDDEDIVRGTRFHMVDNTNVSEYDGYFLSYSDNVGIFTLKTPDNEFTISTSDITNIVDNVSTVNQLPEENNYYYDYIKRLSGVNTWLINTYDVNYFDRNNNEYYIISNGYSLMYYLGDVNLSEYDSFEIGFWCDSRELVNNSVIKVYNGDYSNGVNQNVSSYAIYNNGNLVNGITNRRGVNDFYTMTITNLGNRLYFYTDNSVPFDFWFTPVYLKGYKNISETNESSLSPVNANYEFISGSWGYGDEIYPYIGTQPWIYYSGNCEYKINYVEDYNKLTFTMQFKYSCAMYMKLQFNGHIYTYDPTYNIYRDENRNATSDICVYDGDGNVCNLSNVPDETDVHFVINNLSSDVSILGRPQTAIRNVDDPTTFFVFSCFNRLLSQV